MLAPTVGMGLRLLVLEDEEKGEGDLTPPLAAWWHRDPPTYQPTPGGVLGCSETHRGKGGGRGVRERVRLRVRATRRTNN